MMKNEKIHLAIIVGLCMGAFGVFGLKWCVCDRHMMAVEDDHCFLCEKEDEELFELEEFEKRLKKVGEKK